MYSPFPIAVSEVLLNYYNYNSYNTIGFKKTLIFHLFICQVVIGQFVIGQFVSGQLVSRQFNKPITFKVVD